MKSAFRYFLFLWIITASINNVNAENLTFMVGDDAGVGNLNGPSGDKLISFSYPVGGVNNIVFYNPTSTTPTNAKIKLYKSVITEKEVEQIIKENKISENIDNVIWYLYSKMVIHF